MGEASPLDDRGRFTVDPKFRKRLGPRVIQIWTPHGLLLRPAKGLSQEARRRLPDALKASGEEEALHEVDERRSRSA